jgi:mRNA interferase MazF
VYRFAQPDQRRPVVVLTRDSIIAYLGEVTVAPVTSTIRDIPRTALDGYHRFNLREKKL